MVQEQVVIYTAVYGRYETPRPAPDVGVACLFYTDREDTAGAACAAGWHPVVVDHGIATLNGDVTVTGPMLAHKWWKTHPELACPDAEITIWMDGSMEAKSNRFVEECLSALGDDEAAFMAHPERACIFTEAEYSAALTWRYDAAAINRQAAHYRGFHPAGWDLFATGLIVRRDTPLVEELGAQWWTENITWSHQDQLSLPVLVRLLEEKGLKWKKSIEWLGPVHLHPHG